jgi:hypothetical protein
MPPQNRNENGEAVSGGVAHGGLQVERPMHRIVSRGELSVGSEGNDSTSNLTSPRNSEEYRVRKSSLIGYVPFFCAVLWETLLLRTKDLNFLF